MDDCINWKGYRDKHGYGRLAKHPTGERATHRIAWVKANGRPIPDGLCVLHRCDNPACINPSHLFLGTLRDNLLDMYAKGRGARFLGEQNPYHKLTNNQVFEIRKLRASGMSFPKLSARFGVAISTIWGITNHKKWKHLA